MWSKIGPKNFLDLEFTDFTCKMGKGFIYMDTDFNAQFWKKGHVEYVAIS